jgi:hypothetical protein
MRQPQPCAGRVHHHRRRRARRHGRSSAAACERETGGEKRDGTKVTGHRAPERFFVHAIWADDRSILIHCDQRLLAVGAWMGQSRPRRDKARRPLQQPASWLLGRRPKRVRGKWPWAGFSRGPKVEMLHSTVS